MNVLVTGACGFVGSTICQSFSSNCDIKSIIGIDNLSRLHSESNFTKLRSIGVEIIRGDLRVQSDVNSLPRVDWVIDCAANPSVLAGTDKNTSSRQVMEHNLIGTINLLEYCKSKNAGLILLSTSRVYSAKNLANIPVKIFNDAFNLENKTVEGVSQQGICEDFSTKPPISLYGASKLTSETLLLEYANAFDFPAWVNRCGVLAGAGQFGKADQGVFSYWIHSFREQQPLQYLGFNGSGYQVRDVLHPNDLVPLLIKQMNNPNQKSSKIINLGGGIENSMSLKQLSSWCKKRFGSNEIENCTASRPLDAPWIVMDSATAKKDWNWSPKISILQVLDEIAIHADENPNWLKKTT